MELLDAWWKTRCKAICGCVFSNVGGTHGLRWRCHRTSGRQRLYWKWKGACSQMEVRDEQARKGGLKRRVPSMSRSGSNARYVSLSVLSTRVRIVANLPYPYSSDESVRDTSIVSYPHLVLYTIRVIQDDLYEWYPAPARLVDAMRHRHCALSRHDADGPGPRSLHAHRGASRVPKADSVGVLVPLSKGAL